MELVAAFNFPSHSTELSFSRIMMPFDENEWTTEEKELLQQFSLEFFKKCILSYPLPTGMIDSILIMFHAARFDILPLFSYWANQQNKESVLHFRDLSFHAFNQKNLSQLNNAFGEKDISILIQNWLTSYEVKRNFSSAIECLILEEVSLDETDVAELNLLYEMIRVN